MKKTVTIIICMIMSTFFSCTYVGSGGEVTVGGGHFVHKESASFTIKIIGNSNNTGISYYVINRDEEQEYMREHAYATSESWIEKEFRKNMKSCILPKQIEIDLDADEILYIQVNPIEFNDEIRIEIWKEGILQKEHVMSNNMIPFWTTIRL